MSIILVVLLFISNMNILVIGDSITASSNNYVDILQSKTNHTYTKAGFVGESSFYILWQLKKMNLKKYQMVIIEAGINNLDDVDIVIHDLQEMANYAKTKNLKVIVLTIPPYKEYATWTETKQKNLEQINKWILSKPKNIDYAVDIYTVLSDKGKQKHSIDKIHPNKKGHEIMALEILKFL